MISVQVARSLGWWSGRRHGSAKAVSLVAVTARPNTVVCEEARRGVVRNVLR